MEPVEDIQEQLRIAAEHLHLRSADILENVADAFVALDRDYRIVYANRQACLINKKNLHEFLGKTLWEEWPASVGTEFERHYRDVMNDNVEAHFEQRYVADDYDVWLDVDAYPSETGINLFYRDITSRKLAQQARILSESRYEQLLETTLEGALIIDNADRISYANPRIAEMLGYTVEGLQQMGYFDLFFAEDVEMARKHWNIKVTGPRAQYEMRLKCSDRAPIWVIKSRSEITDNGRRSGSFVLLTDITERKHFERELIASAEREALVNKIGDAVMKSATPADLQSSALALLGSHLNADRCFYVLYDIETDLARIEKDWRKDGVASLEGEWDVAVRGHRVRYMYPDHKTVVIDDVTTVGLSEEDAELFLNTGQRSFIAVPFYDHDQLVGALAVMMAAEGRHWTPEEIAIVEAAAVQVRSAVDAAHSRRRELEARLSQRNFLRDVLTSVTDGKLSLCDSADQMPGPLPTALDPVELATSGGLAELRHAALEAASICGLSGEACHDLITAVGEASMNAIVHGGGGIGAVTYDLASSTVRVRIEDQGGGITVEDLPRATLARGYSTKSSFGHGFKMMLQTAGKVYLLTGSTGTIVVIDQDNTPPLVAWD